jgi:hypothetical protein
MDPITDVFPMGGLHNTLRRLVADGSPVAAGLLAIGDSLCTTNCRHPRSRTGVGYPQLRAAGCYDPVAFRAFWTINGMVRPPDEVYTDPEVVACARDALSRHGSGPPVAQPTRAQLLAALAA